MPRLPRKNPLTVVDTPLAPPAPVGGDPAPLYQQIGAQLLYMGGLAADPDLPNDGVCRIWYRVDSGELKACIGTTIYTLAPPTGGGGGGMEQHGNEWHTPDMALLSDFQTHSARHRHGGPDEVASATPAANVIPKAGSDGKLADGFLPDGITRDTELEAHRASAVHDADQPPQTHGSAKHDAESDAEAIHDNVAGEIQALAEKSSPANADLLLIEDSAASYAKRKVQIGNLPSGTSDHAALINLDYPSAGHTGFCSLATDQTITGMKLVDSSVGLRFGHSAGPLLQGPTSGDILSMIGRAEITPTNDWSPATNNVLRLYHNITADSSWSLLTVGAACNGGKYTGLQFLRFDAQALVLAQNASAYGLWAQVVTNIDASSTSGALRGLNFLVGPSAGGAGVSLSEVSPIYARIYILNYTGTITNAHGLLLDSMYVIGSTDATVTKSTGIKIKNTGHARVTDAISLDIDDITAGTGVRYLIQAGPATPNLRLLANAPPNAGSATEGDSQLFLAWNENGTVNLRRVRWREQSALGSTDKVLIAA